VGQALTCSDAPSATLKIEGNFKRDSFGIDLMANMSVPEQLALLLAGQKARAIANLLGILSGLGKHEPRFDGAIAANTVRIDNARREDRRALRRALGRDSCSAEGQGIISHPRLLLLVATKLAVVRR